MTKETQTERGEVTNIATITYDEQMQLGAYIGQLETQIEKYKDELHANLEDYAQHIDSMSMRHEAEHKSRRALAHQSELPSNSRACLTEADIVRFAVKTSLFHRCEVSARNMCLLFHVSFTHKHFPFRSGRAERMAAPPGNRCCSVGDFVSTSYKVRCRKP